MGRKISRKKNHQPKFRSKKFFQQGGTTLASRGTQVLSRESMSSERRTSQSDFSDTMKKYENIRRMIEDLKYDGNNLARYNERKDKGRAIRTECVKYLRDLNQRKRKKSMKSEGNRLIGRITTAMAAMQKFANQSTIGAITTGKNKTEIYRLVMECRKRGIEAVYEQLNKDLTFMRGQLSGQI